MIANFSEIACATNILSKGSSCTCGKLLIAIECPIVIGNGKKLQAFIVSSKLSGACNLPKDFFMTISHVVTLLTNIIFCGFDIAFFACIDIGESANHQSNT